MHASALANADLFFRNYLTPAPAGCCVVEIGSQDVNGSLRSVCPGGVEYVGVDFAAAPGVDVVLSDPYELPFDDGSVDCCVSSSCFEHSEMFWLLFLEVLRILRPDGLFYLNAPTNGIFHRFPVDCWRFYPESGRALVNWGKRSGYNPALLESYVSFRKNNEVWNDFVGVFVKDEAHVTKYPRRIVHSHPGFHNGIVHGQEGFLNMREHTEDLLRLEAIRGIALGEIQVK